jgi:heme exporter protein D
MSHFFDMGGYALYVWPSFAVAAALMTVEPFLLRRRRSAVLRRIRRLIRLSERG